MRSMLLGALAAAFLQPTGPPLYLFTCRVPLPSRGEIEDYVRNHWPDFRGRFSTSPTSTSERDELVRVRGVRCAYAYQTPECEFIVIARRGAGGLYSTRIETGFARDEHGRLAAEVVSTGPDPACGTEPP